MAVIKSEKGAGAWARGYSSFVHARRGGGLNGWVRGRANLNTSTGVVTIEMDLESDDVRKGPCGVVEVALLGEKGVELAVVTSPKACLGGKPMGKAIRHQVKGTATVDKELAALTTALRVQAHCVGKHTRLFGISQKQFFSRLLSVATLFLVKPKGDTG